MMKNESVMFRNKQKIWLQYSTNNCSPKKEMHVLRNAADVKYFHLLNIEHHSLRTCKSHANGERAHADKLSITKS